MSDPILEIEGLQSVLTAPGGASRHRLEIGRLRVHRGELLGLTGPSGSGKTQLLGLLGLLRKPEGADSFLLHECGRNDGGTETHDVAYLWRKRPSDGLNVWREGDGWRTQARQPWLRNRQLDRLRRRHFGFLFQAGELLPELTVEENVLMPLQLNAVSKRLASQRIASVLGALGIPREIRSRRINTVSGGQFQRIALARAIAHQPDLLLVDEPTASLDRDTARQVMGMLGDLRGEGLTLIVVSHDIRLLKKFADRIAFLDSESFGEDETVGYLKGMYRVD